MKVLALVLLAAATLPLLAAPTASSDHIIPWCTRIFLFGTEENVQAFQDGAGGDPAGATLALALGQTGETLAYAQCLL